jgi:hypothetical protein
LWVTGETRSGGGDGEGAGDKAAGATVPDVAIPNLDAAYVETRGSAPGHRAGWTSARQRRGDGEPVLTIEVCSSREAVPVSARRLDDAIN